MTTEEVNEARMWGVRPSQGAGPIPVGKIPDGATQVAKSKTVVGVTGTIHTVDSEKTFYLNALSFSSKNWSAARKTGLMDVADSTPTAQYSFFDVITLPDTSVTGSMSFPTPLEIPAGWLIRVTSGGAECDVTGFIHGYEV